MPPIDLEKIASWLQGLEAKAGPLPDLVEWAAPQAVAGRLQIACTGGGLCRRVPGGAQVPCLGAITWREILRLRGAGVSDLVLVLRPGGCAGCPGGLTRPPDFGVPVTITEHWVPVSAPGQVDADRRALLFGGLARRFARPADPGPGSDPLAAGVASLSPDYPLPMAARVVRPGCTFCGGCTRLCSAFSIPEPGRLTWRPDRCSECGRCEELCPAGVIGRGAPVLAGAWAETALLAESPERICRCGERYYNNDPGARCLRCELQPNGSECDAGFF